MRTFLPVRPEMLSLQLGFRGSVWGITFLTEAMEGVMAQNR